MAVSESANQKLRLKPEIRAVGVHKAFGMNNVLNGIDLEIRQGEIVAIVGRSGSGKTVLMDHLIGLMRPDEGKVLVADHSMGDDVMVNLDELDQDEMDRVRVHWAVVFQKNALFSGSVYENCAFWLREHTRLSEKRIEQRVREAVREASLDVNDVLEKNRDELSGGMAKRVAIARALAMDPLVLFYDEPTTGLDPVVAGEIHELIYAVHSRPHSSGESRTTLIVTHDRDLLRRIRPRVVMLDEGKICFDGPYERFETTDCEPAQKYLQIMPELQAHPVAG